MTPQQEAELGRQWIEARHKDNEILRKRPDADPIPIGKLPEKVGEQQGGLKGSGKKAAKEREEVLEIIKAYPGITRAALTKQTGLRSDILGARLRVLRKQGRISDKRYKNAWLKYYSVDET